jgi:homeobox protein cut-like
MGATNNLLREEFSFKEKATKEIEREARTKIDALEEEKLSFQSKLESLEVQLSSAPSQVEVDKMKRELRILKRLEYNVDDVDTDRDPEIAKEENDLESVLVSKLRLSEKELIDERNAKSELHEMTESLSKQLLEAEKAKDEASALVKSLERDLAEAIKPRRNSGPRRELSASLPSENPDTLQNILDPDGASSRAAKQIDAPSQPNEKEQDDHSVATIVMAQRDRLRVRCEALEAERDSFKRELQAQVQASESFKADNAKLYEKVRYLQNFGKSKTLQHRDLDLEALEQRYEASVDPFKQFSKSERQRKLKEMSPMERTVFVVAQTFLGKWSNGALSMCILLFLTCCLF